MSSHVCENVECNEHFVSCTDEEWMRFRITLAPMSKINRPSIVSMDCPTLVPSNWVEVSRDEDARLIAYEPKG